MKLNYILGGMILSIIIVGIVVFFIFKTDLNYSPPVPLDGCTVIQSNPGDKKIDIVFFTDGAPYEKVREYADFLTSTNPYNEHKEKFNMFYAGETNCNQYEDAIFCYEKELLKKATVCPNDYIIVLADKPQSMRSSFYIQVVSVNTNQPKSAFLHEFGHAFANLADEYIPSPIPQGSQNCQKKCAFFEKYTGTGCFQGCSNQDYYRSSEASVMRTLKTEEYYPVNEALIKEKLQHYE